MKAFCPLGPVDSLHDARIDICCSESHPKQQYKAAFRVGSQNRLGEEVDEIRDLFVFAQNFVTSLFCKWFHRK